MIRTRRPKDPWAEAINPYVWARALGYTDQRKLQPSEGEEAVYLNGDWLSYHVYADHCDIELYAKVEDADTTEYGTNVYRFDLPATLDTWFRRLCEVDHLWTETPKDREEFLAMYREAAGQVQLDILKHLWLMAGERSSNKERIPQDGDAPDSEQAELPFTL